MSPATSTTYYVTATTTDGDVAIDSVRVNISPSVSITASDNEICEGEQVTLTANNGSNYIWSASPADNSLTGQENNQIINVTPATTTTYTVTESACGTSSSIDITVHPRPTVTASSNSPVCYGDDLNLTSSLSGMQQYEWTGPASFTSNVQNPVVTDVTSANAGTYTVIVTDANGCKDTAETTVEVTVLPLDVSSNSPVCEGDTIYLYENTNPTSYSYQWNGPDGFSSNQQNTFVSNATQSNEGYYVCTVSGNGCSRSDSVLVDVSPLPDLIVQATDSSICLGDSTTLLVSENGVGHVNGNWSTGDNGVSQITVAQQQTTTYYVTYTTTCTATDSLEIVVNNPPQFDSILVSDVTVCSSPYNGKITVYPDNMQYSYDGSAFVNTNNVDTFSVGTHTIVIKDSNGCTADTSVAVGSNVGMNIDSIIVSDVSCYGYNNGTITVYSSDADFFSIDNGSTFQSSNSFDSLQAGNYDIIVKDSTGCETLGNATVNQPDALEISANITPVSCGVPGQIDVNISGGTPEYSLNWSNGDTTNIISNLTAGDYSITVTDVNLCQTDTTLNVPEGNLSGTLTVIISGLSCYGDTNATISVSLANGLAPFTYNWQHDNNLHDSIATGLGAGNYSVTVSDSYGCESDTTIDITQPDQLVVRDSIINVNCYGGNDGEIYVNVYGGTQPYVYDWSNGASSEDLLNVEAGTYYLTVTDNNSCTATLEASVTQPDSIYADVEITYSGNRADVNVNVSGGVQPYTYLWSNGMTTPQVEGLTPGEYYVTITDNNGCEKVVPITIEVKEPLLIPTVLTPNGDGANDTWRIQGIDSYDDVSIKVFNRWGDTVFKFEGSGEDYNNVEKQWDGTWNGKQLPFGSYLYVVKLGDEVHKGTLILKR